MSGSATHWKGFDWALWFVEEAVDGGLEVGDGSEDAALEAASGHDGEKAFDGVEPGGRRSGRTAGCLWAA